jgi:peptide deformylase
MKILTWNLSRLKTPSREMTGPLPDLYLRDLIQTVDMLNGVYLSGIQVGDARRFAIPNPRFKGFPILYNPEIIEAYDLIRNEGEGCLSFPGLWVAISRFKFVEIKYRDSQWKEVKATFGSEDQNTEDALLSKAIQHEIFHMQGICLHERMTDPAKRIKASTKIMKESIAQNKTRGIPQLIIGPAELDPNNLPTLQIPTNDGSVQVSTQEVPREAGLDNDTSLENNTSNVQSLPSDADNEIREILPPSMES